MRDSKWLREHINQKKEKEQELMAFEQEWEPRAGGMFLKEGESEEGSF